MRVIGLRFLACVNPLCPYISLAVVAELAGSGLVRTGGLNQNHIIWSVVKGSTTASRGISLHQNFWGGIQNDFVLSFFREYLIEDPWCC